MNIALSMVGLLKLKISQTVSLYYNYILFSIDLITSLQKD